MTEHGAHPPTVGSLLWPALNFTLFVSVLVYLLRGPVREYFRGRTQRLRDALDAGARARSEAEALRAALARDMAALPAHRERLRAELRETAEHERDTILRLARETAERVGADARLLAEQEVAAARQALRAEVIEEAVRQGTAILRDQLRAEDQHRLVRRLVRDAGAIA